MLKILRVYYHFLARRRALFGSFILLVITSSAFYSITPYFYKLFVDELPSLNYAVLVSILVGYIGVRVLTILFTMAAYQIGDVLAIDGGANARISVFKRIQDLDFAFHTQKSTGSLISAVKRGDGAFFDFFHTIHFRILEVVVEFVIMLAFLSSLDLRIGAAIAVSVAVVLLTIRFVIGVNIKTRLAFNKAEDDVSDVIVDNLINYETVKLFAQEEWERNRLESVFSIWRKKLFNYGLSFRLFDVCVGGAMTLGMFATLLFALRLAVEGQIGVGDFVLVTGFTASFYPQMFELVYALRQLAKNFVDIERYFNLLEEHIEVKDPKKPVQLNKVKGEIEFSNVYFSYKGGQKNALRGVSLSVRQGQSVALVGRSGSGKTTITKALMRFYDIEKGSITIDNINIKKFTKSQLRGLIGVVPQEPILFNNTISYNIKYGKPTATKKELIAASKMAHIHEFIENMPDGYNTNVGERGIKLSGGQKQRVAIARMILSDPDIIVFDEATSHLDSESEKLIQDAFWRASKNKTTIIIAHRLSTIMKADKIIVMNKGKIEEIGTHGELLNKKESLYKHLWNLQTNSI